MDIQNLYDNMINIKKDGFVKLNLNRWPRNRYEAALKFVSIKPDSKVLDVGFGQGDLLSYISTKTNFCYGLDISKKNLLYVKSLLPSKVNLSIQDVNSKTNFEDNFFDLIFLTDVFEHIIDRYSVITELKRILKKNGLLVIVTPNIAKIRSRIRLLFGNYPFTSEDRFSENKKLIYDGGHIQWYTFESIFILANQFNFKINKSFGYGRFGKFHNIYPSLLSGSIAVIFKK
ncbi:MAG: class I SAM-dependent methyltransferase [Candidatus ainarchaeum sp.]|nr:class I SAM-dependent methyltransferase [Candidatus ainarchaeum sp.]MDD4220865.1 class I SAM-dependent methyltransferase [Candidatus ainarchaeum sp.]MDD4662666.1 class I SAM-dependent methyltransferase [Candidatus ainarchaeum sp.]